MVVPILIAIWVIVAGFVQARPDTAGPLFALGGIMTLIGLVLSLANVRKARGLQREVDALQTIAAPDPR
jgi:hypothetical protein